jgi:hypothetical protein
MLRQAQMTLFIAVQDGDLEQVTGIIQGSTCSELPVQSAEEGAFPAPMPARPRLGGAVVFMWDIQRSQTY